MLTQQKDGPFTKRYANGGACDRRSSGVETPQLLPITHFIQSRHTQRLSRVVRGTIIPGRRNQELPQLNTSRVGRNALFLYAEFSAVVDSGIWGNGLCRSSARNTSIWK